MSNFGVKCLVAEFVKAAHSVHTWGDVGERRIELLSESSQGVGT